MGLGNLASPTNLWPNGGGAGGPPGTQQVYFAPRIIVGNVLAGDSAVAYDTDGFTYIPDPGDGTGIEAALAALALVGPGWIHIRRGEYDLASGAVANLQVSDGVFISGDGETATLILGRTDGDQTVFTFLGGGGLRHIGIDVPSGDVGATGGSVILVDSGSVDIEQVTVAFDGDADTALRVALRVALNGVVTLRRWTSSTTSTGGAVDTDPFVHLYTVEGSPPETPLGAIRGIDVTTTGGDIPFLVGGTMELTDCVSTGWRGHAIEVGGLTGGVNVSGRARFVNITSTSSGAAYAGASAIYSQFPFIGVFEVVNGSFVSGTALAAGLDVNWGFGDGFEYIGPTLIDVTFSGFDGAVYGGATAQVTACYHARVRFSDLVTAGVQIIVGTARFRWYDVTIQMSELATDLVALSISGVQHALHGLLVGAALSDTTGTRIGIQIVDSAQQVVIDAARVNINGDGAGSIGIALTSGGWCDIVNSRVAVSDEIGGPGIRIAGARSSVRGCTIDAATNGTQTAPIEVTGSLNVISGNRTTVGTATVPGIDVSGDNNVITGNILEGSTDAGFTAGVDNTGVDNELDHNIAPA